MDNKKIVKQYFNKYFKQQYFTENDHEFKSFLRILNKKDRWEHRDAAKVYGMKRSINYWT